MQYGNNEPVHLQIFGFYCVFFKDKTAITIKYTPNSNIRYPKGLSLMAMGALMPNKRIKIAEKMKKYFDAGFVRILSETENSITSPASTHAKPVAINIYKKVPRKDASICAVSPTSTSV